MGHRIPSCESFPSRLRSRVPLYGARGQQVRMNTLEPNTPGWHNISYLHVANLSSKNKQFVEGSGFSLQNRV